MYYTDTFFLYKDTNPILLSAPTGLNKCNRLLSQCKLNTYKGNPF